ncbi:uncharacterized protein AMSG_10117 [Thecamonas trahens ATCC 50062]|uniref:Uncharacterized protein n=1 Tax=Thecamonas trahens ATCC 50062 TaxID=461836 RepID=A0A0L0DQ51_THETB|nr:hypothetical protein AMSG_10117 [Thecamonas trahens ATCC 50062]KNC54395.1 hypothetical protein AMSG_10117 [Thecamonas trahens ATCC 50062]|eukprot:XP_013753693.1 hypothetical protein AMSG_10117 [Thecamonas trahens ATCC 50062]
MPIHVRSFGLAAAVAAAALFATAVGIGLFLALGVYSISTITHAAAGSSFRDGFWVAVVGMASTAIARRARGPTPPLALFSPHRPGHQLKVQDVAAQESSDIQPAPSSPLLRLDSSRWAP